jgi:8-oxo-dGTP diphosphatase
MKASLSFDFVVFGLRGRSLQIMLQNQPDAAVWSLISGDKLPGDDLDQGAKQLVEARTGLTDLYLEQVSALNGHESYSFQKAVRIVYFVLAKIDGGDPYQSQQPPDCQWFRVDQLPELAPGDLVKLNKALRYLQHRLRLEPIGFELLPYKFSLTQLQMLYEAVFQTSLDTRNFRKKITKVYLLEKLEEKQLGVQHRAAHLYRFNKDIYYRINGDRFAWDIVA